MRFFSAISICCILLFTSCGKEQSLIPDVYVDVSFSYDVELPRLRAFGGVEIPPRGENAGVAGIILYKRLSDGVIVAYDRCSTVNPVQKNKLSLLAGSIVEDKVSGARFNLETGGSPAKAPAERALKRYNVVMQGNNIRVIN